MEAICSRWLRVQIRRGRTNEWLGALGCLLAGAPVFIVNYAFAIAGILYFYYLARVRAKALPPDDTINRGFAFLREYEARGFGPDWWALVAVAVLCGIYFTILRRQRPGEPELFREAGTDHTVMLLPHEARPGERTTLRRATPGVGGILFSILFALPVLLERVWFSLRRARRLRRIDTELCAELMAELDRRGGTVEIGALEEHLGTAKLRRALPQLWMLEGFTFHGDAPQRIELNDLTRDELVILSVD